MPDSTPFPHEYDPAALIEVRPRGQAFTLLTPPRYREHYEARAYEEFSAAVACRPAGPLVARSARNATHAGHSLEGPLPPDSLRPTEVAQRFADHRITEDSAKDLGLPGIGLLLQITSFTIVEANNTLFGPPRDFAPDEESHCEVHAGHPHA